MFGWDDAAAFAFKIADRLLPDPAAKAAAALEIQKMAQAGEFKEMDDALERARMQVDVNKVEAASTSLFVSGWRPYIGWVCGMAFAWHYIGAPLFVWTASLSGHPAPMPEIQLGDLFTLMLGMLGLGGLRSYDKKNGVAS